VGVLVFVFVCMCACGCLCVCVCVCVCSDFVLVPFSQNALDNVTVLLQCYNSVVTVLLQCFYSVVTASDLVFDPFSRHTLDVCCHNLGALGTR
jgi:hypothetical protein